MNDQSFISIKNKREITVNGAKDILSYDNEKIVFDMGDSELYMSGSDFLVKKLDIENKTAEIIGDLYSMSFSDELEKNKKNFLALLFK